MPKVRTPETDAERVIQAYNRACGGCMRLDNPSNVYTANSLVAVTGSVEDVINSAAVYADENKERSFPNFAVWYRKRYAKFPKNPSAYGGTVEIVEPVSVEMEPFMADAEKNLNGRTSAALRDLMAAMEDPQKVPAVPVPAVDTKQIVEAVRNEMLEPLREMQEGLSEIADTFRRSAHAIREQEEARKNSDSAAVTNALSVITGAVSDQVKEVVSSSVLSEVSGKIDQYIKDNYGTINRNVTVSVNGAEPVAVDGVLHEEFDTVMKYVMMDEPVFLVGAAGSGKNFLCKQIADALKLKFWFTNAVTQSYQITGFTDAMGRYQATQFYHAFTEGGLFMLDEMDASIPEVLIILNAAIANRYFDFPAPIGRVEAHKDFRVIAAGNTYGHGADADYVGRNQLDAASLDRFALVEIYYDAKIEESCALGNDELLAFLRSFRSATESCGIHTVISYRAIGRTAKMLSCGMNLNKVIETAVVKSLHKDDLDMILSSGKIADGKYKDALKKISKSKIAR